MLITYTHYHTGKNVSSGIVKNESYFTNVTKKAAECKTCIVAEDSGQLFPNGMMVACRARQLVHLHACNPPSTAILRYSARSGRTPMTSSICSDTPRYFQLDFLHTVLRAAA